MLLPNSAASPRKLALPTEGTGAALAGVEINEREERTKIDTRSCLNRYLNLNNESLNSHSRCAVMRYPQPLWVLRIRNSTGQGSIVHEW